MFVLFCSVLIHLMDYFNKTIDVLINCSKRVRIRTKLETGEGGSLCGELQGIYCGAGEVLE